MIELHVRKRTYKSGKATYEYYFEAASIDGERNRISQSGFATRTQAMQAGQKTLKDYENTGNTTSKISDMSYSDYLTQWLADDVAHTCKDVTVENYAKKIRLYIKPYLGKKRLKSINKMDIRNFLEHMYDEGFSQNTISVCKGIITKSFDYAVDMKMLPYSPANGIKSLKKGGRPPKKPTRSEPHIYIAQDKIQDIFARFPEGTADHVSLMLGYHCGLRLGEAFGLVWEDVDFENKLLKINRQVQWKSDKTRTKSEIRENNGSKSAGNGYWYFAEPKYQSYRIIDLDNELIELLLREKEKRDKAEPYYDQHYTRYYTEYPLLLLGEKPKVQPPINPISTEGNIEIHLINTREDGSYITARTMQHTSSVIHNNLAFPEFDYHSLRHTHATMLSEQGAPIQYIQKRLGHAKAKVTTEVYTNHLTEAMKKQGNNILNGMF